MNAEELYNQLKSGDIFPKIFAGYFQNQPPAKFITSADKKANKDLLQPSNDVLAERLVALFLYDYAIFLAATSARPGEEWIVEKRRLDGLMATAVANAVSNVLSVQSDFIALQEASISNVQSGIEGYNMNNSLVQYDSVHYEKKGKSSVIVFNKNRFTLMGPKNLGDFNVAGKGEAICAAFNSVAEPANQICVCSYHADSNGLRTNEFLEKVNAVCTEKYLLIGMDGNVIKKTEFEADNTTIKKYGANTFKVDAETAGLRITYKDIANEELFNTTSKNRTQLQSQQAKANKADKNPKDHILTRNIEGYMQAFNKFEGTFQWEDNLDMPNTQFAGDHALLFFQGILAL